jgi:hypothetical protein
VERLIASKVLEQLTRVQTEASRSRKIRQIVSPFGKHYPSATAIFERIAAMESISEKGSPLENVVVFLIFFGVILGFCGGVIAVWMTT